MTQHAPRKIWHKKSDRLTAPDSNPNEIACDYAAAPFDRAWRDMDRKWGIDQLPGLVPPDMAAKLGRAVGALNEAIRAGDAAQVSANAANCAKGLAALDAWAEANGKPKANPAFWEYDLDGFRFAVMADDAAWQSAKAARPDLVFYTLREVAVALRTVATAAPHLQQIKSAIPQARLDSITPPKRSALEIQLEDEIPY